MLDPLFGDPDLATALLYALDTKTPVAIEAPEHWGAGPRLKAFFGSRLPHQTPGLYLVSKEGELKTEEGFSPPPGAVVLRPPGRAPVLHLKAPDAEALFGHFTPSPSAQGAVITTTDYRPGALVAAGQGVLVIEEGSEELLPSLTAVLRARQYRPTPPATLPAPPFPPLPVQALVVWIGGAPPPFLPLVARPGVEAIPAHEAAIHAYLEALGHPVPEALWPRLRWLLSRRAGDARLLSTGIEALVPLLAAPDPEEAWRSLRRAETLARLRYLEELKAGLWGLWPFGRRVGEATGLLVIEGEGLPHGRPVRVTAQAAPGRDGVISIERESQLAGPLFSKAVLTLAGYLRGQYREAGALSATLSLVFEETQEEIDGDSAGLVELLALLSALSGLPLRQDVAFTGSLDQLGRVRPVGGVSEKVEGFYYAAKVLGQPRPEVVLPAANRPHLVLDEEAEAAHARGALKLTFVEHADQAIEVAFARPASTVHQAVLATLRRFRRLEDGER